MSKLFCKFYQVTLEQICQVPECFCLRNDVVKGVGSEVVRVVGSGVVRNVGSDVVRGEVVVSVWRGSR